jgi:hypothetical protein
VTVKARKYKVTYYKGLKIFLDPENGDSKFLETSVHTYETAWGHNINK